MFLLYHSPAAARHRVRVHIVSQCVQGAGRHTLTTELSSMSFYRRKSSFLGGKRVGAKQTSEVADSERPKLARSRHLLDSSLLKGDTPVYHTIFAHKPADYRF